MADADQPTSASEESSLFPKNKTVIRETFERWGAAKVQNMATADRQAFDLVKGDCWKGVGYFDGGFATRPPSRRPSWCCWQKNNESKGIPVTLEIEFQASEEGIPLLHVNSNVFRYQWNHKSRFDLYHGPALLGQPWAFSGHDSDLLAVIHEGTSLKSHLESSANRDIDERAMYTIPLRNFSSMNVNERTIALSFPTALANADTSGLKDKPSNTGFWKDLPPGTTALSCGELRLSEDGNTLTFRNVMTPGQLRMPWTKGPALRWMGAFGPCPAIYRNLPFNDTWPPKKHCRIAGCLKAQKWEDMPAYPNLDYGFTTVFESVLKRIPGKCDRSIPLGQPTKFRRQVDMRNLNQSNGSGERLQNETNATSGLGAEVSTGGANEGFSDVILIVALVSVALAIGIGLALGIIYKMRRRRKNLQKEESSNVDGVATDQKSTPTTPSPESQTPSPQDTKSASPHDPTTMKKSNEDQSGEQGSSPAMKISPENRSTPSPKTPSPDRGDSPDKGDSPGEVWLHGMQVNEQQSAPNVVSWGKLLFGSAGPSDSSGESISFVEAEQETAKGKQLSEVKPMSGHWLIPKDAIQLGGNVMRNNEEIQLGVLYGTTQVVIRSIIIDKKGEDIAKKCERLSKELQKLMKIRHQNIQTIYGIAMDDVGESGMNFGVVSQLISGDTFELYCQGALEAWIGKTIINDLRFLIDVSRGLLFLHADDASIFHGNLRPTNIMIEKRNPSRARLTNLRVSALENTVTKGYQAPEVRSKAVFDPTDGPADVYSFGCVVLYALTCEHPSTEEIEAADVAEKLKADLRSLTQHLSEEDRPRYQTMFTAAYMCVTQKPTSRPSFKTVFDSFTNCTPITVITPDPSGPSDPSVPSDPKADIPNQQTPPNSAMPGSGLQQVFDSI
mmetsp:Transcript_258/g.557  ORF Transcript_258/g.557 Transcript_258/m.557 type:complete len:898 (+) Transcript_258:79-2772(+)